MKKIKDYIDRKREQQRLQDEAMLKATFRVVERGGYLWLTHSGVAFTKVPDIAQAEGIAGMLNKARECAVEFERI